MFTFITILLLSLLSSFIAIAMWRRYNYLKIRERLGFTGPKPNFLLGNISDFIKVAKEKGIEYTPYFRSELQTQYGETFGLYFGMMLEITSTDMEFIREVMIKQFSNFSERPIDHFFRGYPMEENLLMVPKYYAPKGIGWKEIRSIISPVFTTGKIKQMYPIMHERIETLISGLEKKIRRDSCIDIYDEFQALTLDVIGRCAFGVEANSLTNRDDEFYVNCRKFFFEFTFERSWAMVLSFIFPWFSKWIRPFSAVSRAENVLLRNLRKIIDERRQNYDENRKVDLIQLLLQQDQIRQHTEGKPPLHLDTIVSNCYAFLLAGYETTSTSLSYTAWLLAKHPDVQEKLYEEIITTFEDRPIDYETVMKMPYLDAVYHESLRLKSPVVHLTSRNCLKETVIKGIRVPENIAVGVPVNTVHWDSKNWSDPMKFDPERFTDKKYYDPLTWIPFGIGPRNCVGMRFAEAEIKSTTAEFFRKFKCSLNEKSDDQLKCQISHILMRPLNGVILSVTSRQNEN